MANISRKYAQGLILFIVLGLSSALIIGALKGSSRKEQQPASVGSSTDAEMKLTDMEYTEMEGGRRLWSLNASEARYYQTEQKSLLSDVRLTFFFRSGEEVHLKSREGILFAGTKNIELWGAVHADLPRGYEVETERAFYEHQTRKVSSETPVRLSGPDVQLEGAKWEYNVAESTGLLDGGVQATVVLLSDGTSPKQ